MKPVPFIGGLVAAVVLVAAAGAWWMQRDDKPAPTLRTAAVERGTLVATVTASGTLAATVQVQVSSQVSGQIRDVLTDFNAEVKTGEVLARIDPETFEYRVRQAEADLEAARAQVGVQVATVSARKSDLARTRINFEEARNDLDRKEGLLARNFISAAERDKARSVARALEQDVASAQAQVQLAEAQLRNVQSTVTQREAQLASARVDLNRTVIRAPVNGVVIKRSIEPGQTVAVSLQAPELFLIAQDLRDMQVEVSIDEAEVSRVRVGQRATFTVDAFPGRTFEGAVRQVRKAAKNEQNVITYTAVVSAENDALALLPGMTANVRIVTDTRNDALKVPNAALRFKPPGWTEPPVRNSALPATLQRWVEAWVPNAQAQSSASPGSGPARAGGSERGGQLTAFRQRLERELSLTEAQRAQLDPLFAAARERFMGMRDLPESERAKTSERIRSELRAQIADLLDASQKKRYAEILVEIAGRSVSRGRVFIPGTTEPLALELRLGLSDGAFTEVIAVTSGGTLEVGDLVYVGQATAATPATPPRPAGPRL